MTLGSALRKLRKKSKQTIRQVYAATKVNNICRYENDDVQPSFKSVVKLSRYYGASIIDLEKSVKD